MESTEINKGKILIVLPNMPFYRREFFYKLNNSISDNIKIIHGINNSKKILSDNKPYKGLNLVGQKVLSLRILNLTISWQIGLIAYFLKNWPDKIVIMLHTGRVNQLLLLLFCLLTKKKYVIWGSCYQRVELSNAINKLKHRIKFFFEKRSSSYIVYGNKAKKYLIDSGYDKSIYVAQNTINVERIISKLKNSTSFNKSNFQLIYVGALTKTKKLETLINCIVKLKKSNSNFHLNIIGDGPYKKYLYEMVVDLNLTNFISFKGSLFGADLAKYFSNSDIFILPGTGGLAVNEAMAYGNIIISTEGDGTISDLVYDNINGQLIDYDISSDELEIILKKFLNFKKSKINLMKKNSKNLILKNASLENMVINFKKALI